MKNKMTLTEASSTLRKAGYKLVKESQNINEMRDGFGKYQNNLRNTLKRKGYEYDEGLLADQIESGMKESRILAFWNICNRVANQLDDAFVSALDVAEVLDNNPNFTPLQLIRALSN